MLLRNAVWILLGAALVGFLAWAYTTYRIPKMYRATVTLYAESTMHREENSSITSGELNSNQQLAVNYAYIFRSNTVMKMAAAELQSKGVNYSFGALKAMTTMTTTKTSIFVASFSSSDQKNLKLIADTVTQKGVEYAKQVVKTGDVQIVEEAETPGAPYYPDVKRNTVTGALIGFLLVSLFFVLKTLTNTTVWSEDDLTRQYDVPVLGTIPTLTNVEKLGANAYVAGKE